MKRTTEEIESLINLAAERMSHKMLENMHKPHWKDETTEALIQKYEEEFLEYLEAIVLYSLSPTPEARTHMYNESADLANIVWMIAEQTVAYVQHIQANNVTRSDVVARWQKLLAPINIEQCTTSLQYPTKGEE